MTRSIVLTVLNLALAVNTAAQETRADVLSQQRAQKAVELREYEPKRIEKALLWFEEKDPLTMIAPHNGFFIQYGYRGKPVGSGIAFGGGWRHDLVNRNARVVLEAGHSVRGYRTVLGDFALPRLLDDRFEVAVQASYRHQPQDDFYGLGFATSPDDRVNYRFRAIDVHGRLMVKPADWLNAGVRAGRMNVAVGSGTDNRFPSIEERFADSSAPGLLEQPNYTYTDLFATLDTRDQPGNARDGVYAGVLWRRHDDLDLGRYSFDSVSVDVQHFLPVYDKKRVFAARFRLMATTARDGHDVPFYFRPTVGGSDSLRSVGDFRYRERNAAIVNFEYRWEAFSGLDMALFSDFATVSPEFAGLEFADIRGAYGIGFRFNTYKAVFLRLDIGAGGSDGIRTFLKFSKAF